MNEIRIKSKWVPKDADTDQNCILWLKTSQDYLEEKKYKVLKETETACLSYNRIRELR